LRHGACRQWVAANFFGEVHEDRIAGQLDLLAQAGDEIPPPVRQIDNPRRQPGGMQTDTNPLKV
jgi:hypothetical protein